MPGVLPDGQPVPGDGALPAEALRAVGERGFGVYVHVPFCASRCGYCDFNTYTAAEGVVAEGYADTVLAELALAGRVLLDAGVDHVSAYALIVEDGTRLAARMRRGELPYPDDDVVADRYLVADYTLTGAGFTWYEVSNWARGAADRCRHNLLYWTGGDWWGFGPGAHSHVGGVRWWNVKHPHAYAARLAAGRSPGHAREVLTGAERHSEDVLLRPRLADGLPQSTLDRAGRGAARRALADGLLDVAAFRDRRAVLTLRGRLLADAVVRDLLP